MTLTNDVLRARSEFDGMDTDKFLDLLERVRRELRTADAREYLGRKMEAARRAAPEDSRAMCRKLLPYLDWYAGL